MSAKSAPFSAVPQLTRTAVASILAVVFAWSCSKDSSSGPVVGPPAQLDVVSGDAQQGVVGKELASPVVVRVFDAKGRAISGQIMNFRVTAGGGSVFAGTATTNSDGVAQERWTLGTAAGAEQTLEARAVDNTTGQALLFATFHAAAMPQAASRFQIMSAPGADEKSGDLLSPQPVVRLIDQYANAVRQPGVTVTATITPPAGSRTLAGTTTITTNNDGVATFSDLAVAGGAGSISLTFAANGLTSAQTPAITLASGTPVSFAAVSATSLNGTVGQPLATLPRIVVKDAGGNGVPGVNVLFALSSDGGTIAPTSVATDANGEATLTRWTLPTAAGTYLLVASSPAVSNGSATFSVAVQPASASSLTIRSGDGATVEVGSTTAPLVVRATDGFGNVSAGTNVTWSITSGGGTLGEHSVATNANGEAQAVLTAPNEVGQVRVTASLSTGPSATFTITAAAGAPTALAIVNPPSPSTPSGVVLSSQPSIGLRDQFGNTVSRSGVPVGVQAAEPYALSGSMTTTTDANGKASFAGLVISGPTGAATLMFTSNGLSSVTQSVNITAGPSAALTARSPTSISDTAGAQISASGLPSVIAGDASGNPAPGRSVIFVVDAGGGSLSANGSTYQGSVTLTTDANGIATVAGYRLPTSAGSTRVTAVVGNASILFFTTVNPASATGLVMARQPGSAVQSGVAFSQPPTVRVRDQYGNIVAKAGVAISATIGNLWTITAGGAATTDATGLASFEGLTITGPNGSAQLTFQAPGLQAAASGNFSIQNPAPDRTPYLQVASGANQTGRVGKALPQPLVVKVVDSVGAPMAGVDLVWDGPGGSAVSPTTSKSDASGLTQTSVTALITLTGTFDGYARLAVDQNSLRIAHFPTTITPGDPAKMVKLLGDQQTAAAGQKLPTEIDIQVQDEYGNGVPGVATQWTPSNGGSVDFGGGIGVTGGPSGPGQGGIVSARWTLGSTSGQQSLTVTAGSLLVTFTATAKQMTGGLATLVPVQGDGTSAPVGSSVNLSVKALDASGAAIPGVAIGWSAASSGSTITATSTTDQTGVAVGRATLPTVTGPNQFTAGASGSPSVTPAAFTVTGTPGRPCRLVFSNLGQTGDRGDPLPVNVQMAVYDSLNNPVPNFPLSIFFRSSAPDVAGSVSPLTTDNSGLASTGGAATLGSAIGAQEIDQNTVRPCGWNNAPFNATGVGSMNARATPVTQLANITTARSGAAGTTVLLGVRATDRHGFYVPNAKLDAAVTSGDGTFGGGSTTASTSTSGASSGSDAGTALLSYTIGSAASQQITITSTDGPSVVITIQRSP